MRGFVTLNGIHGLRTKPIETGYFKWWFSMKLRDIEKLDTSTRSQSASDPNITGT
jgi:hypothetical protein